MPANVTFTIGSVATFATTPKITLDWSGATPDAAWASWRVYRRVTGTVVWTLMTTITLVTTRTWDDWTAPSNVSLEYAVTQVTTVPDESAKVSQSVMANSPNYWLIVPDAPTMNVQLVNVKDDSLSDEVEQESINLIGRGRRFERGDNYGIAGSLEVTFYDQPTITARAQRAAVKAIRDTGVVVYLRNPFGDVWAIALSSMSISRISGVGQQEFATMSAEYLEITA